MSDFITAAVNVPLAVLWSEPGPKRNHDRLILGPTVDASAWANGMDTAMRLWLVGKADTQVLLGERLLVLAQQDGWLQVAAVAQTTNLSPWGYPGWLPAVQAAFNGQYLEDQIGRPHAAVSVPKATIYADKYFSRPYYEVSFQTRLPVLAETERFFLVRLPDGRPGYLSFDQAVKETALFFSPRAIVDQARHFLGLRYIWAGTSAYGFDCSGFTFRLYQSQGVSIPRDADDQAQAGVPVAKADLEPGDLLFFATGNGEGRIHHVGMYIGNGLMIHAPNSKSAVREEAVDAGDYGREFWGARRYRNGAAPM